MSPSELLSSGFAQSGNQVKIRASFRFQTGSEQVRILARECMPFLRSYAGGWALRVQVE